MSSDLVPGWPQNGRGARHAKAARTWPSRRAAARTHAETLRIRRPTPRPLRRKNVRCQGSGTCAAQRKPIALLQWDAFTKRRSQGGNFGAAEL